VLELHYELEP